MMFSACGETGNDEITSKMNVETTDNADSYDDDDLLGEVRTVSADKVSSLAAGMTYAEIKESLGNTASFGSQVLSCYYVDGRGILVLSYDDENDACTLSGEELLSTVVSLDYRGEEFDGSDKKYGYVTKIAGTCFLIYNENNRIDGSYLNPYDDAKLTDEKGKAIDEEDIVGHCVLAAYDSALEVYPSTLYCTEIVIID